MGALIIHGSQCKEQNPLAFSYVKENTFDIFNNMWVVAEMAGKMVGLITFTAPSKYYQFLAEKPVMRVTKIEVEPQFRRKGIACQLIFSALKNLVDVSLLFEFQSPKEESAEQPAIYHLMKKLKAHELPSISVDKQNYRRYIVNKG